MTGLLNGKRGILNDPMHGRFALVSCLLLLMCCSAWAEENLVIKDTDLPSQVGVIDAYTVYGGDGKKAAAFVRIFEESMSLGKIRITRMVIYSDGKEQGTLWRAVQPDRMEDYSASAPQSPTHYLPLPLSVGKTASVNTASGASTIKVAKEETITTPAGTFKCLVCVGFRNGKQTQTLWVSPGVGIVKVMLLKPQQTIVLTKHKKPDSATPPPGSVALVDFDSGKGRGTTTCPKATWEATGSDSTRISTTTLDATETALNTAMSLRWSYHAENTAWPQANIMLAGSWAEVVDLTPYDSVSFYIKGFRPGECGFSIQGMSLNGKGQEYAFVPIKYTTKWTKVTIELSRRDFAKIDLAKTLLFALGHYGNPKDDGNVIWIDEITAHKKQGQ